MNTTYFKNLIMGNVFRTNTSTPIPTGYYIGFSSTAPNLDGTNVTEPSTSGTGYERVRLSSLSEPVAGAITNNNTIQFNESTTDWFPPTAPAIYYVIFDSQANGNLLMYNELTTRRIIETNTVATIRPNSLSIRLTD